MWYEKNYPIRTAQSELVVPDLPFGYANFGNVVRQRMQEKKQRQLEKQKQLEENQNKNFESEQRFFDYINKYQPNLHPKVVQKMHQEGWKINGTPLNQFPSVLQIALTEKVADKNAIIQKDALNFQISTKNFLSEQNAFKAIANYASQYKISMLQAIDMAIKEGYQINFKPLNQSPGFASYIQQLQPKNPQGQQAGNQPQQTGNQPQQAAAQGTQQAQTNTSGQTNTPQGIQQPLLSNYVTAPALAPAVPNNTSF